MAERALSYGQKKGAQLRPVVTVLMREETLLHARNRQHLQTRGADPGVEATGGEPGTEAAGAGAGEAGAGEAGAGADGVAGAAFRRTLSTRALRETGLAAEPPLAQLEDSTALPPAAVEQLLCDAVVRRLVLDPEGQPLDVGRAERTFTGPLRAAILTRDRHCQFPGCTIRASWSQVHHINYWTNQGETSAANAVAACNYHHHLIHRDGIRITPITGGFEFTTPGGRTIGRTTRLADELLVPRAEPPTREGATPPPRGKSRALEPPPKGPGENSAQNTPEPGAHSPRPEPPPKDPGENSAQNRALW